MQICGGVLDTTRLYSSYMNSGLSAMDFNKSSSLFESINELPKNTI